MITEESPMKNSVLRVLVIVITLTLALSSFGVSRAQRTISSQVKKAQAQGTDDRCLPNDVDADSALARLKDGNKRWFNPPPPMTTRNWGLQREATAKCQRPFAVVIACMDSRVPPELIFDQGLGDLFVIRVAGPVLNRDELASLEYALSKDINVKLVIVLGHTNCGAVKGAAAGAGGRYLPELLQKIGPAVTYVRNTYNGRRPISPEDTKNLDRVSIANARFVHSAIRTSFGQSDVRVMWGLYYLASGRVAFDPADVEP
jgi:carbonic anhydrase